MGVKRKSPGRPRGLRTNLLDFPNMSIVLDGLTKRFAGRAVVDRVSVEITDGELFVLLGSSGSGKSTVLRMIAGLAAADEGRIELMGRDVEFEVGRSRRKECAVKVRVF